MRRNLYECIGTRSQENTKYVSHYDRMFSMNMAFVAEMSLILIYR